VSLVQDIRNAYDNRDRDALEHALQRVTAIEVNLQLANRLEQSRQASANQHPVLVGGAPVRFDGQAFGVISAGGGTFLGGPCVECGKTEANHGTFPTCSSHQYVNPHPQPSGAIGTAGGSWPGVAICGTCLSGPCVCNRGAVGATAGAIR
jgi:hypothetical protein